MRMNKSIGTFALILGLIAVLPPANAISQTAEEAKMQCGPVVDGLQLCTTTPRVNAMLGEDFAVRLILVNKTREKMLVPTPACTFDGLYSATVSDPNGSKVLSRRELIEQKIANKTATDQERVVSLPICGGPNSHSFETDLSSNEEFKTGYYLNRNYDFNFIGTYQIEISQKLLKKDGSPTTYVPLGTTIEVQVR